MAPLAKDLQNSTNNSTFNNDFDNRKDKMVIFELPAHITHTALAYRDQLNNNKK
jgi:hypothetical protein